MRDLLDDENTYEETTIDCNTIHNKVSSFIKQYKDLLTKNEYDAVQKQESYLAGFNGLPKIHKSETIKQAIINQMHENPKCEIISIAAPEDLQMRPIVACQDCPTRNLSELLNKLLQPFVEKVKYRVKDNWEFLNYLPSNTTKDGISITADITSLYTNITTESGMEAIEYFIDKYPTLLPNRFSKKFVVETFKFCQNNLYFSFRGKFYRQKKGTGMGKIYAPSLADIKLGYDEIKIEINLKGRISEEAFAHFIQHYRRYLDDIWLLWRHNWIHFLPIIIDVLNSIDPNIQYELLCSINSLDNSSTYLDIRVTIEQGKIYTDIFAKATDTFNYLPFNSAHPRHVMRNIPYCLARRIRGIVSKEDLIPIRMKELKGRLIAKKYPKNLINNAVEKAMSLTRAEILCPQNNGESISCTENREEDLFCVTTYDPNISHPGSQITYMVKKFNDTRQNEKDKFKVNFSFRKNPSIKQLLMFKKSPEDVGVFSCASGCEFCKNLRTGKSITLKTGVVVRANARIECKSRNVIYI